MTNPLADSRQSVDSFIRRLDARLMFDSASGYAFAALCALGVGFSIRETAAKLGLPPTTLTRMLRALAGKERVA